MKALDLFAGSGWGVACQRLGIDEYGVEIMPEAIATREANGMKTIYNDVWDGLKGETEYPEYDLLIASPPCQTFSTAGKGSGRKALDDVLALIEEGAYKLPGEGLRLVASERGLDDRTALVLTPLAHIYRDRPKYVALEQVPTVLPVWQAYVEVLRELGYSAETANLHAEQYGVPQTRKRAILVARLEGKASLPTPTHSKYHRHNPVKLDSGVLPWSTIADFVDLEDGARYLKTGKQRGQAVRSVYTPAQTMAFGNDVASARWCATLEHAQRWVTRPDPEIGTLVKRVPLEHLALIQTFPPGFLFAGSTLWQSKQIGNAVPPMLAEVILKSLLA